MNAPDLDVSQSNVTSAPMVISAIPRATVLDNERSVCGLVGPGRDGQPA